MVGIHPHNQAHELKDYNVYTSDPTLRRAVTRAGAAWHDAELVRQGAEYGAEATLRAAEDANHFEPELHTHSRTGERIDQVHFHPAWHRMMAMARRNGIANLPFFDERPSAWSAHAASHYMHSQIESGSTCPTTMTKACIPLLRLNPALYAVVAPLLASREHDARDIPLAQKTSMAVGMGMTEKQGGSDVRTNTTRAVPHGQGAWGPEFLLTGHKWFFSAPMCDGHLVLARTDERGVTCFFVPRWRPDGSKNAIHIQRLKDKVGNRSNSSSEVEFTDAWGVLIGEEGRGIATIIEMATFTRLDCALSSAGFIRQAFAQALHYSRNRHAFGNALGSSLAAAMNSPGTQGNSLYSLSGGRSGQGLQAPAGWGNVASGASVNAPGISGQYAIDPSGWASTGDSVYADSGRGYSDILVSGGRAVGMPGYDAPSALPFGRSGSASSGRAIPGLGDGWYVIDGVTQRADVFPSSQPGTLPEVRITAKTDDWEVNNAGNGLKLAGAFAEGAFHSVVGIIPEAINQTQDLFKAGLSVSYNELIRPFSGGEMWLPEMRSGIATAYAQGASQGKLIAGAIPVLNVGVFSYDTIAAVRDGRYQDAARSAGGFLGGMAVGAGVQRYGSYGVQMGTNGLGSNLANLRISLVHPNLLGNGRVLAADMGGVPAGYQAHHLIMSQLAPTSKALTYLAEKGLFDINAAPNGRAYPGNPLSAADSGLPLHSGYHGLEYRTAVANELRGLDVARASGASDAALLARVSRIQDRLATNLESGNLWLNSVDAFHRQLGKYAP